MTVPSEAHKHHAITIGRYMLHRQIARGGMATIHIARLMGDEGFSRIVAAKRLHPEFAEDAEFVQMFLDEARIASKVHHRNVVPVLDVVTTGDEVVLVQEYVHGVPLHWLLRTAHEAKTHVPINVAVSIACQVLAGLNAAHETVDEMGMPLNIVHRDVSPQNVMVATDGTARLLDFGVAKASMAAHITREGVFKGKLAYSAPEQIKGSATRQSDIYAMAVVLWELLVGHRMHGGAQAEAELVGEILSGSLPTITDALAQEREWLGENRWKQLQTLEPIIKKGLSVDANERWETAADMEAALATAVPPASPTGVAAWLKALGKAFLEGRDRVIAEEEASWRRNALSSAPRRLSTNTPIPGTLPTVAPVQSGETKPGVTAERPRPPARRLGTLVAALGVLVVALSIGFIVFLAHDSSTTPDPAPAPPGIAPAAAVTPPPAAPPVAQPVAATASAPVVPPPPAATPEPMPIVPPPGDEAREEPAHPTPPRPTVITRNRVTHMPPAARRPVTTAAPAPAPAPAPPPAAAPPAPPPAPAAEQKPAIDCNPPYYFQGDKKIFKPQCL
ncbi:MAG: serine/threonine-protein kinase [Acidobacteriota bacterium]